MSCRSVANIVAIAILLMAMRIYCRIAPHLSPKYHRLGGACVFPAMYHDTVIKQCQLGADGLWWCPRDEQLDMYQHKSFCPNTSLTYAGSDPGKFCHFPFVYSSAEYSTCIRAKDNAGRGDVYWWCATTANYDTDPMKGWTRCHEQSQQLPCHFKERGGVGISAECRSFNGKWVCHTEHNEIRECPRTDSTYAGNSPGERCYFPFLFGQTEYRSCISARRSGTSSYGEEGQFESYSWCATTANYDSDRRWTKCSGAGDEALHWHWRDRRILVPVCVVLALVTVVFCLAASLYFCAERQQHSHKLCLASVTSEPCRHISMRHIANSTTPSAPPPSYLEAVMTLDLIS